jgi:hypothetical protein
LLSIQSVAAFCDSSFPTLCNQGAFELTLLLLGQCGRRKCQKCHDDLAEHRHLPTQKIQQMAIHVSPSKSKQASTQFLDPTTAAGSGGRA